MTRLADDGPGTLRAQIAASDKPGPQGGGVITFAVSGTIDLQSPISFRVRQPGVQIDGGGKITLSGGGKTPVIRFPAGSGNLALANLRIADGFADQGGGMFSAGFANFKNVTFRNNRATNGGALWINNEAITAVNSTFEGNTATRRRSHSGQLRAAHAGQQHPGGQQRAGRRRAASGPVPGPGRDGPLEELDHRKQQRRDFLSTLTVGTRNWRRSRTAARRSTM